MTAIAVAATEIGAWEKTLAANTVDTVTFGRDCDSVRVVNVNGLGALYFTTNGVAPTVGGATGYWLPAIAGASLAVPVSGAGNTVVTVISASATSYSVQGAI